MDRREFLRWSAAAGAALAAGGILPGCDLEDLALQGVRIVDPHAHPDQFYADNPGVVDESSTLAAIVEIGMVASSFSVIGDLRYLASPPPGVPGIGEYASTKYQLSKAQALADAGRVRKILKVGDIPRELGPGIPPGAILSIEGGDPLTGDAVGGDPFAISSARLDEFHELGVRIVTINHYRNNDLGDCQSSRPNLDPGPANGGLTDLGAHVVARMQEKGMLVDVSHSDAATLQGIVATTRKPVIDSHTGLRPEGGTTPSRRLRTLEEMETIASTGGVVCSWPFAYSTDTVSRVSFADWAREIVAMKKALGMAHVGLGTDGGGGLPALIDGYRGVQDLGKLALEMRKAGLSQKDVESFFGGNLLRVLKACIG